VGVLEVTDFVTTRFRRLFDHLIGLEGGYVHHPNDRGGETNWGISKRAHPNVNIRALTRDAAAAIYHRDYYMPLRCDRFNSEPLAQLVFEFGVNAGVRTAAKALQRAINGLGRPLSVDGRVGPATTAAANNTPSPWLIEAFRRECAEHYQEIVRRDPSQAVFKDGWDNRIREAK
jgi:lysozyme family protein